MRPRTCPVANLTVSDVFVNATCGKPCGEDSQRCMMVRPQINGGYDYDYDSTNNSIAYPSHDHLGCDPHTSIGYLCSSFRVRWQRCCKYSGHCDVCGDDDSGVTTATAMIG